MHHAWTIAWRPAGCCIQSSRTTTDLPGLRQAFSFLARPQRSLLGYNVLPPRRSISLPEKQKHFLGLKKCFSTTASARFRQASQFQKQAPQRAPSELAFRRNDLRLNEVKAIFGSAGPPPVLANTLLKALHSQRVNGTLDLELSPKLRKQLKDYPRVTDAALAWLRREYPIDEDAAILRRIEREEAGQGNEELIARAENLGLYKPQSGTYGAKLGEEGDIFGESELQKIRKENELKSEKEQEELDRFIKHREQAVEGRSAGRALEARREDGLEVSSGSRPPNSFERWAMKYYKDGTSNITLEAAEKTTKLRRLLPSILFAAAVSLASLLFAQTWTPPDRASRLMPSQPFSLATVLGIIGINVVILLAWRFPPAWGILNRYFTSVPAVVRPFSSLGSIFSHQHVGHICVNMLILCFIGIPLHEQIGRGNFLGIYIASGVLGTVTSLSTLVFRNIFITSSMGASGAIAGIVAAFCIVNPDAKITIWLLPAEWRDRISCSASTLLVLIVTFEILCMTVPFLRQKNTDHVAHLGGSAAGILGGWLYRRDHPSDGSGRDTRDISQWGSKGDDSGGARWYEKILGR